MARKRRGPGRPPLPPEQRRSAHRTARFTIDECELLARAAEAKGQPVTVWMRETLLAAARRATR